MPWDNIGMVIQIQSKWYCGEQAGDGNIAMSHIWEILHA